jgi:uncharacterized membrane protein
VPDPDVAGTDAAGASRSRLFGTVIVAITINVVAGLLGR